MRRFNFLLDEVFDEPLVRDGRVKKFNPHHDRLGRFASGTSHAPHMDTGSGARLTSRSEEFKAALAPHLERIASHGKPGERDISEMHAEIEAGHLIRNEIVTRTVQHVASPEHQAEVARLDSEINNEFRRATRHEQDLIHSGAYQQRVDAGRRFKAEHDLFHERFDELTTTRELAAREKALVEEGRSAEKELREEERRLEAVWDQQHGTTFGWSAERAAWVDSQTTRLTERTKAIYAESGRIRRWRIEAVHLGRKRSEAYGATAKRPDERFSLSVDNPYASDGSFAAIHAPYDRAHKEFDAAFQRHQSLDRAVRESREKLAKLEIEKKDLVRQARLRIIREVLNDAGVDMFDGDVLLLGKGTDGLKTRSQKRSKAIRSVEKVAPFLPKSWVRKSNEYGGIEPRWESNVRGQHEGLGMFRTRSDNTTLHEIIHHMERAEPRIRDHEEEFYHYRTGDSDLVSMRSVRPGMRYRSSEVTRPDRFYDPYCGKRYGRSAFELMTMSWADTAFPRTKEGSGIDPEYEAWMYSVLLTTGRD